MKKGAFSGMYGDYSSYSDEYDEISDADYEPEHESTEEYGE
jgi:spermidine/putrescine transport system ATP-binding protein